MIYFDRYEQETKIITDTVCDFYRITFESIKTNSANRKRELVTIRMIIALMLHKYTRLSLVEIGRKLNKNHATIIHSLKTICAIAEFDDNLRCEIELLKKSIHLKIGLIEQPKIDNSIIEIPEYLICL